MDQEQGIKKIFSICNGNKNIENIDNGKVIIEVNGIAIKFVKTLYKEKVLKKYTVINKIDNSAKIEDNRFIYK